jgi:hypothetical protein
MNATKGKGELDGNRWAWDITQWQVLVNTALNITIQ